MRSIAPRGVGGAVWPRSIAATCIVPQSHGARGAQCTETPSSSSRRSSKMPPLQFPAALLWQRGIRHRAGLPRVTASSGGTTRPGDPQPVTRPPVTAPQRPAEPRQRGRETRGGTGSEGRCGPSETSFGVLPHHRLPQTHPRTVTAKPRTTRPRRGGASGPICHSL